MVMLMECVYYRNIYIYETEYIQRGPATNRNPFLVFE